MFTDFFIDLKKIKYLVNNTLTMPNQRIRRRGKKEFNEETKVVGIRVPLSKHNEIKNLVNLLVNNILRGKQIRIQTQAKNGIIKDIFNEIGNPNEEETQPSQEIIDLKKGFSELLKVYNKIRKKTNDQISGLLNAEGIEAILNGINFDFIKKVEKSPIELIKKVEKSPKIKRIHPLRVKSDITAIKGYLSHVPLDIAPNDDKGVYFTKAQQFVESLIKKYEKLAKKGNPYTEKELKFFKEEIYENMLSTFDLLNDLDELETFLSYLTEEERKKLYSHKLLDEFDLLP